MTLRKKTAGVVVICITAAAIWWWRAAAPEPPHAATVSVEKSVVTPGRASKPSTGSQSAKASSNASVAADTATRDSPARTGATIPPLPLDRSNDYASLLAELRSKPGPQTATDALTIAAILQRCQHSGVQREEYRQTYAVDIASEAGMQRVRAIWTQRATSDTQRAAVAAIAPRLLPYVCRGLIDTTFSDADVAAAFARAAALGDTRARVWLTEGAIWDRGTDAKWLPENARATARDTRNFPTPDEGERSVLMSALWSQDPIAMRMAGEVLSRAGMDFHSKLRESGVDISRHADEVWHLAACSFGFDCSANSSELAYVCATRNQCSVDYASYLREHALTPAQFAQVEAAAQEIVAGILARTPDLFVRVSGPGALITVGRQMTVVRTR